MEFDKSKILTVVTADNLKCKQKGWVHNSICSLRIEMNTYEPYPVFLSDDIERPFVSEGKSGMFFYPAPEPTYTERQTQWLRENNVVVGTKVRITKSFRDYENGVDCMWNKSMHKTIGIKGTVTGIDAQSIEVLTDGGSWWYPYFVLEVVKELTYAERQAQWVKENNVKEGTKVRVTRTFASREDGCGIPTNASKALFVGDETCTINGITPTSINVYSTKRDDWWCFPYFVLEVIKEPTYSPYNNDELNHLVGKLLIRKGCEYPCLVTSRYSMTQVSVEGHLYNAEQLLELFTLNGDPCGVRES